MSNLTSAQQDLIWLANRLRGILEIAPYLEQLGSLENAIREAETRFNFLHKEAKNLSEANDTAKEALKDFKKAQDDHHAQVRGKISEDLDAARGAAELIKLEKIEEANKGVSEIEARKASLEKIVFRHTEHVSELEQTIKQRQEELLALNTEIESLKRRFT